MLHRGYVFGGISVWSCVGGEFSSLVGVECDDKCVSVVCTGEENHADASVMTGFVCK